MIHREVLVAKSLTIELDHFEMVNNIKSIPLAIRLFDQFCREN